MREVLTSAQMRAVEVDEINRGGVTARELMARAGRAALDAAFVNWPDLVEARDRRACVLCGPGNNGGDGFVVAGMLRAAGWWVDLRFFGTRDRLSPAARHYHDLWQDLPAALGNSSAPVKLIVDAVFGTGLRRALGDDIRTTLADLAATHPRGTARRLALDAPSGLCLDSGRVLGGGFVPLPADLTVSFHRGKLGHYLADGPQSCGMLKICDIGLHGRVPKPLLLARPEPALLDKADLCGGLAAGVGAGVGGHKYDFGHTLIVSGPLGHAGAARLAARAALRVGAGLVSLASPPAAMVQNTQLPDAVMVRPMPGAAGLGRLLQDRRIAALCLGPGMGLGARGRRLVATALEAKRATVLDADALSAFANDPSALFAQLHPGVVLTPHGGEFARLFPDIAARLSAEAGEGPAFSKCDATIMAAARAGAVVLLKGHDTVIAAPDGRVVLSAASYHCAAPWLATAGAGDVLAGMIAGLMARGLAPFAAAQNAAWLHVAAARNFGPGLIADDLPEQLPAVFRALFDAP